MKTKHVQHTFNGKDIVALNENGVLINSAQQFLDLIEDLPTERIILYKENIGESFFDLRTGLAGEILEKAVNNSRSVGIVGDYSRYASKSLNDFIYQSNKSNNIVFADSLDEALRRLSA